MTRRNAVVGAVTAVQPRLAGGYRGSVELPAAVTVTIDGQVEVRIETGRGAGALWVDVLEGLRQAGLSGYTEVDPASGAVTRVLVPIEVRVVRLTAQPSGDVVVELLPSHARHVLGRGDPDFDELRAELESALADGAAVLVTEDPDSGRIIDVRRPLRPGGRLLVPAPPGPAAPPRGYAPVDLSDAEAMFTLVSGTTCDPVSATSPCIPFRYPRDGCWARAHEMRRLMDAAGTPPGKVWIYGWLTGVPTVNHHSCSVSWGWHVAPTLDVTIGGEVVSYVIDPSLFDEPVPESVWAFVQNDPTAVLVHTGGEVFYRASDGTTYLDPTYAETATDLATYRAALMLDAANYGPPPYAACYRPDLYVRDNLADEGLQPLVGGGISCSPDINHFRQELTDPQATLGSAAAQARDDLFENVEVGQPNFIYVRLSNRGLASGDASIDVYWMPPSTLPAPSSWTLLGSIAAPSVAVGEFRVAGPLVWNSVPAQGHYCFVAVVGAPGDPKPSLTGITDIDEFRTLIRERNNVTWKNFDVVDQFAGGYLRWEFEVRGWPGLHLAGDLELDLRQLPAGTRAELTVLKRLVADAQPSELAEVGRTSQHIRYAMAAPALGALRGLALHPSDHSHVVVEVMLPDDAPDGAYDLAVLQRVGGAEVGRVTKRLQIGEHPFVANRRSGEVHAANCEWVGRMSGRNKVAYRELALAVQHGLDGCHYCMPELDAG